MELYDGMEAKRLEAVLDQSDFVSSGFLSQLHKARWRNYPSAVATA